MSTNSKEEEKEKIEAMSFSIFFFLLLYQKSPSR